MIDISFQRNQFEVVPTLVPQTLARALKSRIKVLSAGTARGLPKLHTLPVSQMLETHLSSFDPIGEDAEAENAFYIADLGEVYCQHLRWKALLPRIEPFFAMKCNPDPMVMRLMASLGIGFDCASKNEIQQVLDMNVNPSRIIFANPCKQDSFVKYAYTNKVRMMTFDNTEELHKIKRSHPEAQLVLRILTDDSKSLCKLGLKFGAPLDTTRALLQLDVIGVSFHVGSGCFDANAYGEAVVRARRVFDEAKEYGYDFKFLDVGGGFPSSNVTEGITFEKIAKILGPTIDALFEPEVRVIAEPGRYYVGSAFTLATQVIARRTIRSNNNADVQKDASKDPSHMYYINDGVYGSFNCTMFDHQVCEPRVLLRNGEFAYRDKQLLLLGDAIPHGYASVWGPTCDSIDCITSKAYLPLLEAGDWLYFDNMGAYTITAASQFNGFKKSKVLYTTTEDKVTYFF
ncbi:pyridoxal-dependent decarboxylase [Lobosporangium transversale]|uniref:ornithine decarboxylase n=1 Tax=Lobosporangium transversale TaxID=64571 RepID=A0A1Y2GVK3_9FUNG|nr:pyridoxal-dependent decarboxylase [Lobosporangium transversale]ORZ20079.1 pyridoxal-dependent decarboxylase [Lobosporangium transversale]|eukprot:XP_021882619.1 pyridoxal-dependent decarboxylase [Lobosporangium transversale]